MSSTKIAIGILAAVIALGDGMATAEAKRRHAENIVSGIEETGKHESRESRAQERREHRMRKHHDQAL